MPSNEADNANAVIQGVKALLAVSEERAEKLAIALSDIARLTKERDAAIATAKYVEGVNTELRARLGKLEATTPVEQKPKPGTINPAGEKVTKPIDLGGKRVDLLKGAQVQLYDGGALRNGIIGTQTGNESLSVMGEGVTLENITFPDGGGFLIKASGEDAVLRNITAGTFSKYALYGEFALNLLVDGFTCRGGSTTESILRFDECSGTLRNIDISYTTATRRAAMRGTFVGTWENIKVRGGVVGPNPLGEDDGGQTLGWWKFLGKRGFTDATNKDECIAAVRTMIDAGVADTTELVKAAAAIARTLSPIDIGATVKRRALELAKHSDITVRNADLDGLRWGPNTKLSFTGGSIGWFENPDTEYPEPKYVMPGDAVRSFPDITFTGTDFRTDIVAEARKLGVKLVGCTVNGRPVSP